MTEVDIKDWLTQKIKKESNEDELVVKQQVKKSKRRRKDDGQDKKPKAGDDGMVFVRRFYNELAAVIPGFGDLKPKQNFITGALIEYQPGYGPDNFDLLNPI